MIVIKVELWPFGSEANKRELVRGYVSNDGTGTKQIGNYKVRLHGKDEKPWREVKVNNWQRETQHVWKLIAECLSKAVNSPSLRKKL